MLHWLKRYFTITITGKSQNELMIERSLFLVAIGRDSYLELGCWVFSRWWLLFASCITTFFAGSLFAFHSLAESLDLHFNTQHSNHLVAFALGCFAAVAFLSAPYFEREGPRFAMFIGSVMVTTGFALSHLAVQSGHYTFLLLGHCGFTASGFGILVITAVSTAQKWFPDLRGVVAGLTTALCLSGYALFHSWHAFIASKPPASHLTRVFLTSGLWICGGLFIASLMLRTPPPTFSIRGYDMHRVSLSRAPYPTYTQSKFLQNGLTCINFGAVAEELEASYCSHVIPLSSRVDSEDEFYKIGMTLIDHAILESHSSRFHPLYKQQRKAMSLIGCLLLSDLIALAVSSACLLLPAQILVVQAHDISSNLFQSALPRALTLATGVAGAIAASFFSDALICILYSTSDQARKIALEILLCLQLVALLLVAVNASNSVVFRVALSLASFTGSGSLALLPAMITDLFGVFHTGPIYSFVLLPCVAQALLGGVVKTPLTPDALLHQVHWMLGLTAASAVALVFVRSRAEDRFFHGYQYTAFGRTLISRPILTAARDTCLDDSVAMMDVGGLSYSYPPEEASAIWHAIKDV
ncbi:hypothetical protein AC1031_010292 [Aphanomyces cochlioides]|nr:hypothetical protein AC1031_010292 [Aphanomyces cochlioides]